MIRLPPHWEQVHAGFYRRHELPTGVQVVEVYESTAGLSRRTMWRTSIVLSFSDYMGQTLISKTLTEALRHTDQWLEFVGGGFPTCSNGCHVCLTERQTADDGELSVRWGRWLRIRGGNGDVTFCGSAYCDESQERLPVGGRPIRMIPAPSPETVTPMMEMPSHMRLREWDT